MLGPFSPSLVAACEEFGGGNACENKRWESQLFNNLMRQQGKVQLPSKPPQFVLFAFDGSYSIDAWQKSRNFAKTMTEAGKPIKFTYVVSGVYFVSRGDRKLYDAPELGQSSGLYQVLAEDQFRYDTSKVANENYWPQQENGIWNFPLGQLKTALTRKNVVLMDYNFYYVHSRPRPNSSRAKFYEEDMFKTYMNYFQQNYQENRAPVHIGHHFSAWNSGAYWNAMFRFAEAVCG